MTALEIAGKLTEAQRRDWISTVLIIVSSEPQKRAFLCGYNGYGVPPFSSPMMRDSYSLGRRVSALLSKDNSDANG